MNSNTKFYKQVEDFVKPRWMSIFIINIITYFATQIVASILSSLYLESTSSSLIASLLYFKEIDFELLQSYLYGTTLVSGIAGIVSSFIQAGLVMVILDAYRKQEQITTAQVFKSLKEHARAIATIAVLTSFISVVSFVIPYVQFVSPLIVIFMNLYFSFTYFLLKDGKAEDGLSALKLSVTMTKGHKWSLFKIALYYLLMMYAGLLVGIVGILLAALGQVFSVFVFSWIGSLVMMVGFGMQLYLMIRIKPYLITAPVIYYANLDH